MTVCADHDGVTVNAGYGGFIQVNQGDMVLVVNLIVIRIDAKSLTADGCSGYQFLCKGRVVDPCGDFIFEKFSRGVVRFHIENEIIVGRKKG